MASNTQFQGKIQDGALERARQPDQPSERAIDYFTEQMAKLLPPLSAEQHALLRKRAIRTLRHDKDLSDHQDRQAAKQQVARMRYEVRAQDAAQRLGRDETEEERTQREAEDQAADVEWEAAKKGFRPPPSSIDAEWTAEFNTHLHRFAHELPPEELAEAAHELAKKMKAWVAEVATRRSDPRLDDLRVHSDRIVDRQRKLLAAHRRKRMAKQPAVAPAPPAADSPRRETEWRVAAGLSSGPPPRRAGADLKIRIKAPPPRGGGAFFCDREGAR